MDCRQDESCSVINRSNVSNILSRGGCEWLSGKDEHKVPIAKAGAADLTLLLALIIKAVKPEAIFLIEDYIMNPGRSCCTIIISLAENKRKSMKETFLRTILLDVPFAHINVMESLQLEACLLQGHIYYSFMCTEQTLVYSNGLKSLPVFEVKSQRKLIRLAKSKFAILSTKAASFLRLAGIMIEEKDTGLVLFLLHQALELSYKSISVCLFGNEHKSHSIEFWKFQNQVPFSAGDFLFSADQPIEMNCIKLLDDAYINGRYSPYFSAPNEALKIVFEGTMALHNSARIFFDKWTMDLLAYSISV